MKQLFNFSSAVAGISLFFGTTAHAASDLTFVSGRGTDAGQCATQATACRTFGYALTQTNAGGEIKALNPANYAQGSTLTINKAVSITGVEGASLLRTSAGDAITVLAPATSVVNLTDLTIDGFNRTGTNGVRVITANKITIRNCVVRNFASIGIALYSSVSTKFLVEDVAVSNAETGFYVLPAGAGALEGTINRVSSSDNSVGLRLIGNAGVTLSDSLMLNNSSDGVLLGAFSPSTGLRTLRMGHTTISGSPRGIRILPPYVAISVGNNFLAGNAVEVDGTLTLAAPR